MGPSCLGTVGGKGCHGQHPVIKDRALSHTCERTRGGTKTIGVPEYKLTVTNPVDDTVLPPEQEEVFIV